MTKTVAFATKNINLKFLLRSPLATIYGAGHIIRISSKS